MAATDDEKEDLWVQWTRDATARYVAPEDIENSDDLADDMMEVATKFADSMLDELEERFDKKNPDRAATPGRRQRKAPGRRKRKPAEETAE